MKPIMIWQCPSCKSVQYSNAFRTHQMDYCKCQETAIDLETYGCRYMGNPEILERRDGYFDELLICLREQGFNEFFVEIDKLYVTIEGVFLVRNLEKEIIEDYIKSKYEKDLLRKSWEQKK